MKSMILKDIYNITHNMRSLGLLLVMFVFIMLPQGGAPGYITTSCVLCSMMVITTFSFDNMSKWEKYALVMPVTKQDLVAAKFIVLLIFTAFGAVSGLVLGIIGGLILGSFHPADPTEWLTTAAVAGAGICAGIFFRKHRHSPAFQVRRGKGPNPFYSSFSDSCCPWPACI